MITQNASTPVDEVLQLSAANLEIAAGNANWVANLSLLWSRRGTLARAACISFVVSLLIAFIIPKRYESTARIMPPENSGGGAAMFAALAGHGLEGVGGLVASLLGGRNSGALYISL